jgi:hypothetical protein
LLYQYYEFKTVNLTTRNGAPNAMESFLVSRSRLYQSEQPSLLLASLGYLQGRYSQLERAEQADAKEKPVYRQAEFTRVAWKYDDLPIPPVEKFVHLIHFVRVFQKI